MTLARPALLRVSVAVLFAPLLAGLIGCGSSGGGGGGGSEPDPLSLTVTLSGDLSGSSCATLRRFLVEGSRPLAALQMRHELVADGAFVELHDWQSVSHEPGRLIDVALWAGSNVIRFRGRTGESDWVAAPAETVAVEQRPELLSMRGQESAAGFLLRWDALGDPGGDLQVLLREVDLDGDTARWSSAEALRVDPETTTLAVARDEIEVDPDSGLRRLWIDVGQPGRGDVAHYAVVVRAADGCQSNVLVLTRHGESLPDSWTHSTTDSVFSLVHGVGRPWGTRAAPLGIDVSDATQTMPEPGRDGLVDLVIPTDAGTVLSYVQSNDSLLGQMVSPVGILASTHRVLSRPMDEDLRGDLVLVADERIDVYVSDPDQPGRFDPAAEFRPEPPIGTVQAFGDGGLGDFDRNGVLDLFTTVVDLDPRSGDPLKVSYLVALGDRTQDFAPALSWSQRIVLDGAAPGELDGYHLLVGDLDLDGRDDLLHARSSASSTRWVVELARGGGAESRSSDPFTDTRALRWDHSSLVDITGDGFPDLVTLRETTGGVVISGYANDGSGGLLSGASVFDVNTGLPSLDECHLQVKDVEGDGLVDLILGRAEPQHDGAHGLRIWAGVRDAATGLQDGTEWSDGPTLEFRTPDREGRPQFLAEDLNGDGLLDFASSGQARSVSTLSVRFSQPAAGSPPAESVARLASSGVAVANELPVQDLAPAPFGREGDLFLGVVLRSGTYYVEYLASDPLEGAPIGKFGAVQRLEVSGLAEPVDQVVVSKPSVGGISDLFVLTRSGAFGELRWSAAEGAFVWRPHGVSFIGQVRLFAADFDGDATGDCLVWQKRPAVGSLLGLFRRERRGGAGDDPLVGQLLPVEGDVTFVDTESVAGPTPEMPDDRQDELLVLVRPYQAPRTEFRVYRVLVDPMRGTPHLLEAAVVGSPDDFEQGISSACALHVGATVGVEDQGLAGVVYADQLGRLFHMAVLEGRLQPPDRFEPAGYLGTGPLQLGSADFSGDGLRDLAVFDPGNGSLAVLLAVRSTDPMRPRVVTGSGGFVLGGPVSLPDHQAGFGIVERPGAGVLPELWVQRQRGVFGLTAIERIRVAALDDAARSR